MNKMEKKLMQLTEQDLHMLVEDAVMQYMIQEGWFDSLKGGAQALGQMAGKGTKKLIGNVANGVSQGMNRMGSAYNAMANKAGQMYDSAAQTGRNVYGTMKAGAANANIQSAKNNAIKALNNFLQQAQRTPGVAGRATIQSVQNCIRQLNSAGGRSSANFSTWRNQTLGA